LEQPDPPSGNRVEKNAGRQKIMTAPAQPTTPGDWHQLANRLRDTGKLNDAVAAYQRALSLDPNFAPALVNLGTVYTMLNDWPPAIAAFRKAVHLIPTAAILHSNLANALEANSQWPEALASHQRAAELDPTDSGMWQSLGYAQFIAGQRKEALASLHKAVSLRPGDPILHWTLANALLAMGQWEEGWNEFEWRLAAAHAKLNRGFPQPQWDGSPAPGKTLLVHVEGGHGDGIQFIRFLPFAEKSGATLILECQPALFDLFKQIRGVSQIIPRGQTLPNFDLHIPLPGIPRLAHTTEKNIPAKSQYLIAPPDRAEKFAQLITPTPELKVGLVWAGRPMHGDVRTRGLDLFAPLFEIPGVRFFSLQKGQDATQKPPPGMNLIDLSEKIADFADTAGLLAHLDLLITVDTAAAHLAGAMGKPVWVLIPHRSDFRWLLDREDSPWYPSMRLFRQGLDADWQMPIRRIADQLKTLAQSK
jgi:tetratricopeptide (TPR) repeat protein